MNPDVQVMWVDELRALDNDLQGTGALKNHEGKMCCLGVLCEIAAREGVIPEGQMPYEDSSSYSYGANEDNAYLPPEVALWAGIDVMPQLNEERLLYTDEDDGSESFTADIAELNDTTDYNFDVIADLIETVGFNNFNDIKDN